MGHLAAARRLGAALLVALACLALFLLPGAGAALEYDRQALLDGELWRIVGGHLVHYSPGHLALDVLAFALLAGLCACLRPGATWLALGVATVAIPLTLFCFDPGLDTYRGLSGLDSTLFVLAALVLAEEGRRDGRRRQTLAALAALTLFAVKLGYETATGAAVFAPPAVAGEVVVPLAHLVGAAAALTPWIAPAVKSGARRGELHHESSSGATARRPTLAASDSSAVTSIASR